MLEYGDENNSGRKRVLRNDEKEYKLVPVAKSRAKKRRDIRSPNRCGVRLCRILRNERTNCPGLTTDHPASAQKAKMLSEIGEFMKLKKAAAA